MYQSQQSGAPVIPKGFSPEYVLDDVDFDGRDPVTRVLVEAKGNYEQFIDEFWWSAILNGFVDQARSQAVVSRARGIPLEWRFMDEDVRIVSVGYFLLIHACKTYLCGMYH